MRLSEQDVVRQVRAVTLRRLRLWVKKGWIVPVEGERGPLFEPADVARLRLVCELRDELNVNEDAVPVVLSLMDQMFSLRREMKALARAVDMQSEDVRKRIRDAHLALTKR